MVESIWPLAIKTREDLKINELTNQLLTNDLKEITSNIEKVTFMADQSSKAGHRRNACLMWNPKKKTMVASSYDLTALDDRSLEHSAMCCLRKCSEGRLEDELLLGKHVEMEADEEYLCSGYHVYMYEEPCRLL